MKRSLLITMLLSFLLGSSCVNKNEEGIDVLIIGGGASGVSAGIQASRLGAKTLIVEETDWLGGMLTAAGVSAIDGNYNLPAGIWGEFKNRLAVHYGDLDSLKTGWVSNVLFEPSVGNEIFNEMVAAENNLQVLKKTSLKTLKRKGQKWSVQVNLPNGKVKDIEAKIVIDATELGDVAKLCGVRYDIGMENRHETGEDIAPEAANSIVQDLTYVAILKDYGKDVTIQRPEGYNPNEFACACTKAAKHYTMCFVYFLQHELGYNTLGLADDEYPTEDKLPFIPYHRESRRIHGQVRFTLNHITKPFDQKEKLYRTCIAVGDYPVDHHHTRYQGKEKLPNLYFYPIPSYGLPLGTLIPQDVEGLIVAEKSISVSNIVNGTTRLQPVVMQIGQAAGTLAALSIEQDKKIAEVSVRDVQNKILEAGGYLLPYLDVPVDSPLFASLQRIGSTGIMKGVGRNVEWSNQTWFRADALLVKDELQGLSDVYPSVGVTIEGNLPVSLREAADLIKKIAVSEGIDMDVDKKIEKLWTEFQWGNVDWTENVSRAKMALLIDKILDPFNKKQVDVYGNYIGQKT